MSNGQTKLYQLTHAVVSDLNNPALRERWVEELRRSSSAELVELTGNLTSEEGKRAANIKAMREAVISEIERKNTEKIVATMERLDKTTTRLTWAALLVAVVGAILAAMQVLQGFHHP